MDARRACCGRNKRRGRHVAQGAFPLSLAQVVVAPAHWEMKSVATRQKLYYKHHSNMSDDLVQKYFQDFQDATELDVKTQAVANLSIVGLAAGPAGARELLRGVDKLYNGQPEEVCATLSQRLGELLRLTAYDAAEVPADAVDDYLGHVEKLSGMNSSLVNASLCDSFTAVLNTGCVNVEKLCAFCQRLIQAPGSLQRSLSTQLIPAFYGACGDDDAELKQQLGTAFGTLISDADAYVRAQAARGLGEFLKRSQITPTASGPDAPKGADNGPTPLNVRTDRFVYSPSYVFVCYDRLV